MHSAPWILSNCNPGSNKHIQVYVPRGSVLRGRKHCFLHIKYLRISFGLKSVQVLETPDEEIKWANYRTERCKDEKHIWIKPVGGEYCRQPKTTRHDRLIAEINNHFSTEIYKHFMKNEQEQSAQFLPSRQHAWT